MLIRILESGCGQIHHVETLNQLVKPDKNASTGLD